MNNQTYIIAEAGVNHNGSSEMAFQLVDVAAEAGADAIKFQTFKAKKLVTKSTAKAHYQQQTTEAGESQYEMLKLLELEHKTHYELISYCNKKGIDFLSTAFDMDSLGFLTYDLGLTTLKLPSGDITNGPLILAHALSGCELIVSTGMATLGDVEQALGIIAFGMTQDGKIKEKPTQTDFQEAYLSENGQRLLKEKVSLLHCTTEYPAPLKDINLNAMITMRKAFGLNVGYSDHSEGIVVPTAAATLGASIIEKHFTLDKSLPGPDHKASLEPDELKKMVEAIRTVEQVMGDGLKGPKPSELDNLEIARKSLVAACDIKKGDVFTKDNITMKRPATGRSPMEYWECLGKKAIRNILADEVIE